MVTERRCRRPRRGPNQVPALLWAVLLLPDPKASSIRSRPVSYDPLAVLIVTRWAPYHDVNFLQITLAGNILEMWILLKPYLSSNHNFPVGNFTIVECELSLIQCFFKFFVMQLLFPTIIFISEIFQFALSFNVDKYCPIVYEDPLVGNSPRSSYFGYSVGIVPGTRPIIIIGAPRSNGSFSGGYYESGAVFTCPLKETCKMLQLELPSARTSSSQVFNKSTAWIGGSIDAEDKEGGMLAMCSPRMKYTIIKDDDDADHFLTGACYWMKDINSSPYFATPFTKYPEKFVDEQGEGSSFYNLGVAQYGMSVHFPELQDENKKMLGGAPGVYNWKGSVVLYEDDLDLGNPINKRKRSVDTYTLAKSIILEPAKYSEYIKYFDYFGYQVSSGRFFQDGKLLYVSSSPRGASQLKGSTKCTGSVMIFRFKETLSKPRLEKVDLVSGIQIGEYFGASIAVTDINGDSRDDLIVGSPHYFDSNGNEGKVYIYYGALVPPLKLVDSLYGAGQFGLAVASLGDLNQDGYGDFAVGAPYEGNGAIYIYNGGFNSIKMTQRITPEDLNLPLRGFGISFSRPIDLDDNKFPDFAVGSYLSGHTVVLRSYPTVTLTGSIYLETFEVEAGEINSVVNKFFITLYYSGKKSVDQILVERKIEVDSEYKRFKIRHNGKDFPSTLIQNVSVKYDASIGEVHKSEYLLLLVDNVIDTESRVIITTSHKILNDIGKGKIFITNSSVKGEDKFCKMCAVYDITKDSMNLTKDFTFIQKCGQRICQPDLKVECSSTHQRFVIGSHDDLSFDVNISNLEKDTARQVSVIIEFENVLKEKVLNRKCNTFINEVNNNNNNRTKIKCSIGTLIHNKSVNMSVSFDTARLERLLSKPYLPALNFSVSVQTSGKDIDKNNDKCSFTLELDAVASIKVIGKSDPDQQYFIRGDSSSNSILLNHIYQVNQEGHTPILDIAKPFVHFYIPQNISLGGQTFTFLTEHKYEEINGENLDCHDNSQRINNEKKGNIVYFKEHQLDMLDGNNTNTNTYLPSEDITLYINCSTPNVHCLKISCPYAEFGLSINMTLNITSLENFIGKKNVILIASNTKSQIGNTIYHQFFNTKLGEAVVATPFISTFRSSPVQWWIILLAIILGILLLALIMYALVKFGFFHREKKEQLESLKNNDSLNDKYVADTEVMEDNLEYSSTTVID